MKCKYCGRQNLDEDDFAIVDGKNLCFGCRCEEGDIKEENE